MKETLVIQSDIEGYAQAEAFVERVCTEMCADNEFGIISMAILQSITVAITYANGDDSACQLQLECGSCTGGMYFMMHNESHAYDYTYDERKPIDGVGQMLYTINRLADLTIMSDDRHTLRLEFMLKGVESPYSRHRQKVLKKFHSIHIVEA